MAPLKTKPRKTLEDYMRLPEGVRAELIDGEIFMSPSPREKHQAVIGKLYRLLCDFVERGNLGRTYIAPFDVHLPGGGVVQPDILFIAKARLEIVQDWVRGAPDLLVEGLSPENRERDLVVKRGLYAENGVPEYWIVDPEERTIEILRLKEGRYSEQGYFEIGDTLASPLLTGFSPSLQEIFA